MDSDSDIDLSDMPIELSEDFESEIEDREDSIVEIAAANISSAENNITPTEEEIRVEVHRIWTEKDINRQRISKLDRREAIRSLKRRVERTSSDSD